MNGSPTKAISNHQFLDAAKVSRLIELKPNYTNCEKTEVKTNRTIDRKSPEGGRSLWAHLWEWFTRDPLSGKERPPLARNYLIANLLCHPSYHR